MKMHGYFLLNVKHGASQLYWGGGLQLFSAGTAIALANWTVSLSSAGKIASDEHDARKQGLSYARFSCSQAYTASDRAYSVVRCPD